MIYITLHIKPKIDQQRTTLKSLSELEWYIMVSSSSSTSGTRRVASSTSGTRRVALVTTPVIIYERRKDRTDCDYDKRNAFACRHIANTSN